MRPKFYFDFLLFMAFTIIFFKANSQCTIFNEVCDSVLIINSINDLNDLECLNSSAIPSPCSPLCGQGGVGHNTSWVAFRGENVVSTFKLTIGSCTSNQGLQWGIREGCNCDNDIICRSIPCIPPNSIDTDSAYLSSNKIYTFWIDGCSGDICNFTINTTGRPCSVEDIILPSFYINHRTDRILDPVCEGACEIEFNAGITIPGAIYYWSNDNFTKNSNGPTVKFDFQGFGTQQICVYATYRANNTCYTTQTICAKIDVIQTKVLRDQTKSICQSILDNGGKSGNCIFYPDHTYYCQFTGAHCCTDEEYGTYTIKPIGNPGEFYFIGCEGEYYRDPNGQYHHDCLKQKQINIPAGSMDHYCDSSIIVSTLFPEISINFSSSCLNGYTEINPNILNVTNSCGAGESFKYAYEWYYTDNKNKEILISKDEILKTPRFGLFKLHLILTTLLGTISNTCNYDMIYFLADPDLKSPIKFGEVACVDQIVSYCAEKSSPVFNKINWQIEPCGTIVSASFDSSCINVYWNGNTCHTTQICITYFSIDQCYKVCKTIDLKSYNNSDLVDFNATSRKVCPGKLIQLYDSSSCQYPFRKWEITKNGKLYFISEKLNPSLRLFLDGFYTVSLTASNPIKNKTISKKNFLEINSENCYITKQTPKDTLKSGFQKNSNRNTNHDNNDSNLLVYPNPSSSFNIVLENPCDDTYDLKVLDLNGRILYSNNVPSSLFILKEGVLKPGIYFVTTKSCNKPLYRKFIVVK